MFLLDVANYLEGRGIGRVGEDIFCGLLPDSPDVCVALFEYAGGARPLHWPGESPGLQTLIRHPRYADGRLLAERVVQSLHGLSGQVLGSTRYLLIQARQSPVSLGRDEKDRCLWSVNYRVIKEQEVL